MLSPIKGPIVVTRPFGVVDPIYHNYPNSAHSGVDIRAKFRTPYYATISGTITSYDRGRNIRVGRGKEVRIRSGNLEVRYCHLDEIVVKSGNIKVGDLIGYAGWTGYVLPENENGSHLHYEVLLNDIYVDPMKFINKGEDMATPAQIDEQISLMHQLAFGKPASAEVFKDRRNLFNSRGFVEASLQTEKEYDKHPDTLKNKKSTAKKLSKGIYEV